MCIFDGNNGRITLSNTVTLRANMARKHVAEALETIAGTPCVADDAERVSMLSSGMFLFHGAEVACVCSFSQGRLRTVEFVLTGGTAAQQRETQFAFIGRRDPCPDDMQSVRMRYPFGTVWIVIDTRSGDATLRITYAAKE